MNWNRVPIPNHVGPPAKAVPIPNHVGPPAKPVPFSYKFGPTSEIVPVPGLVKPIPKTFLYKFGAKPTPDGWYLEQVLNGEMKVSSNPNHPSTLTDRDGQPVRVWYDERSGRIQVRYFDLV